MKYVLRISFIFLFCLTPVTARAADPAKNIDPVLLEKIEPLKEPFDHSLWDQFLKTYVNEAGQVNYAALKEDAALLDAYTEKIEDLTALELQIWPREEQLALWLNVYHLGVIRLVLEHYPVESIQDIPGVWEINFLEFSDQERFSLNRVRKNMLLDTFHDEKIHLALSSAAVSSPRLRRDAFTAALVEGQLFNATREFVNDDRYVLIDRDKKRLTLSRILKWYMSDFILDFGRPSNDLGLEPEYAAMLSFIAYYLEDYSKVETMEAEDLKIKYFPFDWSLNDWKSEA